MKYLVDIRDEILIREKEPLLLEAYSYTDREWIEGDWLVGVYDGSITTIAITELEAKELIRNKELYKSIIKNNPKLQYQFVHFLSFLPKYQNLT